MQQRPVSRQCRGRHADAALRRVDRPRPVRLFLVDVGHHRKLANGDGFLIAKAGVTPLGRATVTTGAGAGAGAS
jgi:hypothetical protein